MSNNKWPCKAFLQTFLLISPWGWDFWSVFLHTVCASVCECCHCPQSALQCSRNLFSHLNSESDFINIFNILSYQSVSGLTLSILLVSHYVCPWSILIKYRCFRFTPRAISLPVTAGVPFCLFNTGQGMLCHQQGHTAGWKDKWVEVWRLIHHRKQNWHLCCNVIKGEDL